MTDRFRDQIIPWLFEWEGTSYENDPDDPGGATKYGIDQRSHSKVNIKALTADQATAIYWNEYLQYKCDRLKQPLDWVYFNACVNTGYYRATTLLEASNNDADKFLDEQEAFYRRLVESRPSSQKYLKGWLARTEDLRKKIQI
jgi:lysozyme family protein